MKTILALLAVVFVALGGSLAASAADLKDQVRVQILSVGLHPDMDPGLYVCSGGHLHIRGIVQNMTGVTLASLKIEGKAYDTNGKLLGTARPWKKAPALAPLGPGQKTEFNIEFLTITGPMINLAKRNEIVVVEAKPKE